MKPKMRRNLSGAFAAREMPQGVWRLTQGEPSGIDVYLRGAAPGAADLGGAICDVVIEWRDGVVALNVTARGRPLTLEARSAIVHEPLPRLYDALPLAGFDERARRFWRRVFFLVRIPGGRLLLRLLARRTRDTR